MFSILQYLELFFIYKYRIFHQYMYRNGQIIHWKSIYSLRFLISGLQCTGFHIYLYAICFNPAVICEMLTWLFCKHDIWLGKKSCELFPPHWKAILESNTVIIAEKNHLDYRYFYASLDICTSRGTYIPGFK